MCHVGFCHIDGKWLAAQTGRREEMMRMQSLDHLLDRPKLYYNIDGVGELVMGFMCLGYALFGWMQVHSPEGSFWHWNSTFLVYLWVMWAIIHYGSKAIHEPTTY